MKIKLEVFTQWDLNRGDNTMSRAEYMLIEYIIKNVDSEIKQHQLLIKHLRELKQNARHKMKMFKKSQTIDLDAFIPNDSPENKIK